jgi:diguanylate cyclase (GGDEF)-like protein
MRKGRFSRVNAGPAAAGEAPSLAALLAFDFRAPASEDDGRIAADRARSLGVALPLLAASHLLWSGLLLYGLWRAGAALSPAVAGLLGCVLALDAGLMLGTRAAPPHRLIRLTALHTGASAFLWAAAAALGSGAGASPAVMVRAAVIAGAAACLPCFFPAPAILILGCAGTCLVAFAAGVEPSLLTVGAAVALFLASVSVSRARESIAAARHALALEAEAKKARRFVTDYEESGRGWFWETNADGALTYASPALAAQARIEGTLVSSPFDEAVLAAEPADSEARRRLEFHLASRIAFAELAVRAPGEEGACWSLSGSPNFDDYGRFLGFRGLGSSLTERQRSQAETTKLARFDSLTGLPNRAMMAATLDEALANAAERQRGCALMLIDLDRFKQVNDTLGHPMGDKLLKRVAARLAATLGGEGQIGRVGGDEFQAVLPDAESEARLGRIADAIIAEASKPYEIDGHRINVGASVGIAVAEPGRAYAAALVKEADLALYAAKADGRGTHRFYAPAMQAAAVDRQILERDLGEALERDQLRLLYQPVVDAVSEEVIAFEALVRWQHPTRGLLGPETILPVATDTGIMPRIGAWILRSACAEAAAWPEHVRVAVNLSPAEFAHPGLAASLAAALAGSGLDPDRLELEISEQVFLADGAAGETVLVRLKGLGVRLALDNFGTGHSGLGHLRSAPLDKIKIDRSFVAGAAQAKSRNAAIIRAIVVLAESLGIDITAEGTETLEDLALVRRLGCGQVQGFLFGKPMPADEARAIAVESRRPSEAALFSRPPRHRLLRKGALILGELELPVRLRNISKEGAMVECDRDLAAGTRVMLDLDEAGRLDAEVRWSQRGQVGMRFDAAFPLRKLARPRPGPAARMLTPAYLDPDAAPAPTVRPARSPLVEKRRRTGR